MVANSVLSLLSKKGELGLLFGLGWVWVYLRGSIGLCSTGLVGIVDIRLGGWLIVIGSEVLAWGWSGGF